MFVQQLNVGEGGHRSAGVVISEYPVSQSHRWFHSSETAVPITVKHDNDSSAKGELYLTEKCQRVKTWTHTTANLLPQTHGV